MWIGGFLASAVVTHHVLKPRLPVYVIQPTLGLPRLKWDDENIMLGVPLSISMHNDNYMEIDIYSLAFDLFYMDGDGDLLHLTDIKDHGQVEEQNVNNSSKPMLWQIPSRSNFTINDVLYLNLEPTLVTNLLWNSRFYSSLWHGSGAFWLPTTGVAHVKAKKNLKNGIPATISIICDNLVDNLVVQGLSCVLHDAQAGWGNLEKMAQSLRVHAIAELKANEIGVILETP